MFNAHNRSFIASEAIGINIRVKLTTAISGEAAVAIAGAGEDYIGVTETPIAANKAVSVRLKNSSGTARFTAAGTFAYGAQVYGVAAGKVDDVVSTNLLVGTALQASAGDGALVEVLYAVHGPLAAAAQAAVTATSTNGTAAAASASLANLAAEAEKIGDDVRAVIDLTNALRTALISKGVITGAA